MKVNSLIAGAIIGASLIVVGCSRTPEKGDTHGEKDDKPGASKKEPERDAEKEILAARAGLDPEDRKLVEAQEYCAIAEDSRLGVMGVPYKVMVKGQPVFLCCKGCERRAFANAEKTLARVEELKAKVKAEAAKK